jgi:hypothetical protein
MNTDLDQAFPVNPDPDKDPIRIQGLMIKNLKKKNNTISFLIKNSNFLISKLQEKRSALKRHHPALDLIWIRIHSTGFVND